MIFYKLLTNLFYVNYKFFINNLITLFKIKKRVYCCGVFDLCHLGHMKLFEKIFKSFNEPIHLIVGVHSDLTVKTYKREPILSENIRLETIKLCKYVDEVLPDADLIVTSEFIIDNNIDCVIIGEEYKDTKDKIWYKGALEQKKYKYIERYEELSTTDIIIKIKNFNF